MLDRAERLRRAFKAARARANEAPASTDRVAKSLFDFVFDGV
jgi:hypothetical protein